MEVIFSLIQIEWIGDGNIKIIYWLFKEEYLLYKNWKKLPTSDRNSSLQFRNNVKAPHVRTIGFTRLLFQSTYNDISDSINWKDKHPLLSKEELHLILVLNWRLIVDLLIIILKQLVVSLHILVLIMHKLIIANLNNLF